MEKDQEYLEMIVKGLVDKPEEVKVTRTIDDMGVLLEVVVAKEDTGTVIGKAGANAQAIRRLMSIVGIKNKARVNVRINA